MTLYEMTGVFAELYNSYDEMDTEDMQTAWFDTLDGLEMEIEDKAENIAVVIKNLSADIDGMKKERDSLTARIRAAENRVDSLKEYLLAGLNEARLKKVDRPRARVTVRNNAESVKVLDDSRFIEWAESSGHKDLLKYSAPTVSKTAVKAAMESETIPYVEKVRTQSVVIK